MNDSYIAIITTPDGATTYTAEWELNVADDEALIRIAQTAVARELLRIGHEGCIVTIQLTRA